VIDRNSKILVIDDTPVNLLLLENILGKSYAVQTATSGAMGLVLAQQTVPDLILLDVMMPGMDGFETLQLFRQSPQLRHVPVVFVTASTDFATEIRGLELGAADYITKPINPKIALRRIANLLERGRVQLELRESEQRFRTLIEWSPNAIGVHRDGIMLYVNPAAIALFGASCAGQLVGQPVLDRVHPDFHAIVRSRLKQYLDSGAAAPVLEEKFLKLDGTVIDVEVQGTPIVYDGAPAIRVAMRDISARKQSEEAQRIAATAFEAQQGMVITDAQQVILRVNKAFTEITGYSAEEALGSTPALLASGRHDATFYAAMWDSLRLNGSWQGEIWNRRKSGEVFPEWLTISAVRDATGHATHYVAAFNDISLHKRAEDQINHLVFYDPLTGLPNRRRLLDRLKQALCTTARLQQKGALLFVDLDNFKTLNETLGHHQGDLLLEQVAPRLANCIREGDMLARVGGDKFVVLLEDLGTDELEATARAEGVGENILALLNTIHQLGNCTHHNTCSIGIALFGLALDALDEPLKRAELAMYHAKTAGRNCVRFYDLKMQAEVMARAAMEADLRSAMLQGQFVLHYQAQVAGYRELTGVEALLRWQHPERGLVSPLEFIPLAERTGLIVPLGLWVLETACAQLVRWALTPGMAHLSVAVNVSARQLHHKDFVAQVLAVLAHTGADPRRLKLELTESLMVQDIEDTIAKMGLLKAQGVGFSLDDFGTGYSSLSYLKRLPLDQLKIDQSFVRNILTDANDAAIAKMVIALSGNLGLAVIAEGVETEAQRDFLAQQGCHAYQGYFFSCPLPPADFEKFARQQMNWIE
jgi:diguanylate cyclase (GGDEF)-like protein/PAS domain S-box-containing protein